MAESENYKKGSEMRANLMGEKFAADMNKSVYDDPMMKKFGDYAREAVFGMLWSGPGLALKTKTLLCVFSAGRNAPSTSAWLAARAGRRMNCPRR